MSTPRCTHTCPRDWQTPSSASATATWMCVSSYSLTLSAPLSEQECGWVPQWLLTACCCKCLGCWKDPLEDCPACTVMTICCSLQWFLERIRQEPRLELAGVHSHLGSTISDVGIFADAARIMIGFVRQIRDRGFNPTYLNIGGGLGIDYRRRCATLSGNFTLDLHLSLLYLNVCHSKPYQCRIMTWFLLHASSLCHRKHEDLSKGTALGVMAVAALAPWHTLAFPAPLAGGRVQLYCLTCTGKYNGSMLLVKATCVQGRRGPLNP